MSKDLQHYLDHPDELPDDPAILAQLAEQINTPVVATDADPADEKDVKKEEPAPSSEKTEEPKPREEEAGEEEPKGIATRDGKGTIPYEVLKTERERRQAAESTVAELTSKVEEIQAQLAKGTDKGDAKAGELGEAALAAMDPEELEALRADYPVFGNVIDKLMGTISALTGEVQSLKQSEQVREASTRKSVAAAVQEAIDNEPVLLHLQTTDPALFNRAVELDASLRQEPRYKDMVTRFAKVAEIMSSTFGPFEGIAPKVPPTPKPSVSKEAVRDDVLKKVESAKVTPRSMSDIPAGDPPESDEVATLENLSAVEISDRLMKMSSDQRDAFLKRF